MKTTDLRIGNLVLSKGVPVQIEEIMWETVRYCFGEFPIDYVEPIPITEDWLWRLGFERREGLFRLSKYWVEFRNFDTVGVKILFGCFQNNKIYITDTLVYTEYVHQLQNIYFALTGKELQTQFD
jgi:hypothetical protein